MEKFQDEVMKPLQGQQISEGRVVGTTLLAITFVNGLKSSQAS
jgi:hypothetical protein